MIVFMVGLLKVMKIIKMFALSATGNITMYKAVNTATAATWNGRLDIALSDRLRQDLKVKLRKIFIQFTLIEIKV